MDKTGEITVLRIDGREFDTGPKQDFQPRVDPVRCRCGSKPTIRDQTEIWTGGNECMGFSMTTYYVRCTCGRVAEVASRYKRGGRERLGYGTQNEAARAWNLLQASIARLETGDER